MTRPEDIPALIDSLCEISDRSVAAFAARSPAILPTASGPIPRRGRTGLFAYPELRIDYRHDQPAEFPTRAFGRLNQPGRYATSIARPAPLPQISDRAARTAGPGLSRWRSRSAARPSEIPYPYVLDGSRRSAARRRARGRSRPLVPDHRACPYRRRDRRRRLGPQAPRRRGRSPCSTARGSISASPACAIIPARRPSTPSATSCSPTTSATSTSSCAWAVERAAARGQPLRGAVGARAGSSSPATRGRRGEGRRRRLAAAPDAGLPSDRAERRRHHPRQHRRRPVQRQDDLRPSRRAAARSVADDRPLRRPAPEPDDRRLCPRPRLSARRPCARRHAADRDPDPADRRGPAGAVRRRRGGHRRGRRRS